MTNINLSTKNHLLSEIERRKIHARNYDITAGVYKEKADKEREVIAALHEELKSVEVAQVAFDSGPNGL